MQWVIRSSVLSLVHKCRLKLLGELQSRIWSISEPFFDHL